MHFPYRKALLHIINHHNNQDNEMARMYDVNHWDVPKSAKQHNESMMKSAEKYANAMRKHPSFLEKIMLGLLKSNGIKFDFQKIFYIKNTGRITRYFIADFYIPSKKLVIEVDGNFHKNQIDRDEERTKLIEKHFPKTKVIRVTFEDINNLEKASSLMNKLKVRARKKA